MGLVPWSVTITNLVLTLRDILAKRISREWYIAELCDACRSDDTTRIAKLEEVLWGK